MPVPNHQPQYPTPIPQTTRPPVNATIPLPLAVVRQTAQAYVQQGLIDEFQHQNWFFANCPWLGLTDPQGGGSTLTYRYQRWSSTPGATAREFNKEVTETYSETESESTETKMLNSAFAIDEDIATQGGMINHLTEQFSRAITGVSDLFNEMVIRGDSHSVVAGDQCKQYTAFDGFEHFATKTWHNWNDPLDLSMLAPEFNSIRGANSLNRQLMTQLGRLVPYPTYCLGNNDAIPALSALAQEIGNWSHVDGEWVQPIDKIGSVSLVPMGRKCASLQQIIPTKIVDVTQAPYTSMPKPKVAVNDAGEPGLTDATHKFVPVTNLYFSSFGNDSIMGIYPGDGQFKVKPPNMSESGYVHRGDVEMKCALVMKSRNCLGVMNTVFLPYDVVEWRNWTRETP
jgi:hypothetical protein